MSTRLMKIATVLLSVFIIGYVGVQLPRFFKGEGYTLQTVYKQTVEENLAVTGIFFREEKVFPVGRDGVVSCNAAVGEKVGKSSKLLTVYRDHSAAERQREIENLSETLQSLEKAQLSSQSTDVIRPDTLNSTISSFAARLIASRDNGSLSEIRTMRADLREVYARREILIGANVDYSGQIAELKGRLDYLEGLGSEEWGSVYTDVSGYFVDHIDGYEDVCTMERLAEMTAAEADQMIASYSGYNPDSSSVMVVTSQKWRFAFTVPEEQTLSMRTGKSATLRFPGGSQVSAVVEELRRDSESGRFLVIMRGDTVLPMLLESRVQAVELLVGSSVGLKVPKEAIRFNESGQMGVYVVIMDKMYFRAVGQVYENDSFILCPIGYESADKSPALKLYDTIIVGGMDLYDQKPVA
ncbi:MAG: hypothetical protein HFE45_00090 [Oscillospiraceae bacterium]|nr:hypothetical protein [Oscillospiraceae bacterium]